MGHPFGHRPWWELSLRRRGVSRQVSRWLAISVACGVSLLLFGCSTDSTSGDSAQGSEPDSPELDVTSGTFVPPDAAVGVDGLAEEGDATSVEPEEEPFSFFVTSLEGMRQLSGSNDGFGGDLGGLDGADEICRQLADTVDAGHKTWRAFLSVTSGPDGQPVHAIDRIGEGPWYDRNGRLVAANKADLLHDRPVGDPQVVDDLPNEYGQGQKQYGDNHDTLTGSNGQGQLNDTDPVSTCQDWTSGVGPGSEKRVMGGHSWPRDDQGGGGGGAGGDGPFAPPPWVNACSGLDVGDTCDVQTGKKTFEGVCGAHPDDENLVLCVPPDGNIPSGPPGGGGGGPGGGAGGGNSGEPWIGAHTVPGCAPGVQLEQLGGGEGTDTVGGAGGYGGIYCFALEP